MYKFKNKELEKIVFNHPSVELNLENRRIFQKLELMGDKLIDLYLSKYLFNKTLDESEMSLKLSFLVSKKLLGNIGGFLKKKINFNGFLSDKIITDCLESYIGAIFFDNGNVEKIILFIWKDFLDINVEKPFKTQLQEKSKVKYVVEAIGKNFIATCYSNNKKYEAIGSSKNIATTAAAKKALESSWSNNKNDGVL